MSEQNQNKCLYLVKFTKISLLTVYSLCCIIAANITLYENTKIQTEFDWYVFPDYAPDLQCKKKYQDYTSF